MIFASVTQFHIYFFLVCVNAHLAYCPNTFLNVKALAGDFNQEKALYTFTKVRLQL